MEHVYNYEAMRATSQKLNDILNGGISPDAIQQFVNYGMTLDWKGAAADRFRADLLRMKNAEKIDAAVERELHFIADYPKMCAERIQHADLEFAQQIRAMLQY